MAISLSGIQKQENSWQPELKIRHPFKVINSAYNISNKTFHIKCFIFIIDPITDDKDCLTYTYDSNTDIYKIYQPYDGPSVRKYF